MDKTQLLNFIAERMGKSPRIVELSKRIARPASGQTIITLDFPINPKQRWDQNHPHQQIYDLINENRRGYEEILRSLLPLSEYFAAIPVYQDPNSTVEPYWNNDWMPPLDGVALYSFLAFQRPKIFLEVGSGNSTKFARKAVGDQNLDTKIISIDPAPRADIDGLCDEIVREPVEDVNLEVFDQLDVNDILFVDNSHRVFMNSDATTIFLDVFPRLKPGVLVEIHDVTLPYDYPSDWVERYYSEQYLLAAYLLAKGTRFEILLPNYFISFDQELRNLASTLWQQAQLKNVKTHGCSFWMRMK